MKTIILCLFVCLGTVATANAQVGPPESPYVPSSMPTDSDMNITISIEECEDSTELGPVRQTVAKAVDFAKSQPLRRFVRSKPIQTSVDKTRSFMQSKPLRRVGERVSLVLARVRNVLFCR